MKFKIDGSWIIKKAFVLENAKYLDFFRETFDIEADNKGINPLGFHIDGKEIICYYDPAPTCSTDIIYHLPNDWNEASNFLKQMYESIHINESKKTDKPKVIYTKGQWVYLEIIGEDDLKYGVFKIDEDVIEGDSCAEYSEEYQIIIDR